jgi:hypothetical protein
MAATATYRLFSHPRSISELGCWERHLADYTYIVGYSALGVIFLMDERSKEYLLLDPLLDVAGNARACGSFDSLEAFERSVLKDDAIAQFWLRPARVEELARLHGPLDELQVYIPLPLPFLGGTGTLDKYEKGNLWSFADIAGQASGVCD